MQRTVSDLLTQQQNKKLDAALPQVKRKRVAVLDVLFPSHSLVVATQGYGRQIVQASFDLGTFARPKVTTNNYVTIEYDDTTGQWIAKNPETSNRCLPTTPLNAPNIPLPTFTPVIDSSIVLEPFRVDTNFNPNVGAMGQIVSNNKMPPVTTGGDTVALSYIGRYLYSATAATFNNWSFPILGDYAFFGDADNNKAVCFNISDAHHLNWISVLSLPNKISYEPMAAAGKYVYAHSFNTVGNQLFYVIDVSDPYNMSLVGTLNTGSRGVWGGHLTVWTQGAKRYVTYTSTTGTVSSNRITTVDVTTAASPTLVGDYQISPGTHYPMVLDGDGHYFYVATYQDEFYVLDYATPATPTVVGSVGSAGFGIPNGDLLARQDYAYVSCGTQIFPIYIGTPASPVVGTPVTSDPGAPPADFLEPVKMIFHGAYLIVLNQLGGEYTLSIFSLNAPATPTFLSRWSHTDFAFTLASIQSLSSRGRFIYGVGTDTSGFGSLFIWGF